ncbi:MAG: hypothetical protein IIC04_13385, partial [Proteobacteria bacterium]|nr:hypothetical protein [Pseudomonadota bacterium]
PGFISNMLGLLTDAFSAPLEAESAEEPVVAFGEAKPSPQEPASGNAATAPGEPQVLSAESPSVGEEPGFISNMLGLLTDAFSAPPQPESAEDPVVAFSEAKPEPAPAQEQTPVKGAAKVPGPEVAAAEAAKKEPPSKPTFSDRLAKFLSLDVEPPPRVKKRKRTRANTETAMIGFPMLERPSEYLKGVALNLSGAPDLGKPAPPIESCISKNRGRVLFCIEPVAWPELLRPHFQVNTYMYGGAKSIVRYDDGKATFVHALFPSASFEAVLGHFERRFGPPTDRQELWLTSLSSPARSNPMSAWWSIEGDAVTTLQIRKYDDTRGGFPDMEYGAISLHVQGAKPIFPLLSTANLMLLKFKRSPLKFKRSP